MEDPVFGAAAAHQVHQREHHGTRGRAGRSPVTPSHSSRNSATAGAVIALAISRRPAVTAVAHPGDHPDRHGGGHPSRQLRVLRRELPSRQRQDASQRAPRPPSRPAWRRPSPGSDGEPPPAVPSGRAGGMLAAGLRRRHVVNPSQDCWRLTYGGALQGGGGVRVRIAGGVGGFVLGRRDIANRLGSRRWWSQSTHSRVASSRSSRPRQRPRRWISSVLDSPIVRSARALSSVAGTDQAGGAGVVGEDGRCRGWPGDPCPCRGGARSPSRRCWRKQISGVCRSLRSRWCRDRPRRNAGVPRSLVWRGVSTRVVLSQSSRHRGRRARWPRNRHGRRARLGWSPTGRPRAGASGSLRSPAPGCSGPAGRSEVNVVVDANAESPSGYSTSCTRGERLLLAPELPAPQVWSRAARLERRDPGQRRTQGLCRTSLLLLQVVLAGAPMISPVSMAPHVVSRIRREAIQADVHGFVASLQCPDRPVDACSALQQGPFSCEPAHNPAVSMRILAASLLTGPQRSWRWKHLTAASGPVTCGSLCSVARARAGRPAA